MSTIENATLKQIPVRTVMSPEVLGIVPDAPLEVALRLMVQAGVRHLPVIDEGRCLGLLHESDVLWRLWSTADDQRATAGAVARAPAPFVELGADLHAAARRMADTATDAVLVVDAGRVVGIVTATNLVYVLGR